MNLNYQEIREKNMIAANRILEEIQASITIVGGRVIPLNELKLMNVQTLLDMSVNNGIDWKILPKPEKIREMMRP